MMITVPKKRKRSPLLIEAGIVVAIALMLILILPYVLTDFRLSLLGRFLALAIAALGIDLIWGLYWVAEFGAWGLFCFGWLSVGNVLEITDTARCE